MFRTGEFIVLLDNTAAPAGPPTGDRGCTLFQITGIDSTTDTLQHASSSLWNSGTDITGIVPITYTGGATPTAGVRDIGTLNWVQFSIDATGATPKLMMNRLDGTAGPQVLADGIEDLQIAYACDIAAGAPTATACSPRGPTARPRRPTSGRTTPAATCRPPACNRPQAVRITIVARSTEVDTTLAGLATNRKPAVEDGVVGAVDAYRHRVLTTTVYPRNR